MVLMLRLYVLQIALFIAWPMLVGMDSKSVADISDIESSVDYKLSPAKTLKKACIRKIAAILAGKTEHSNTPEEQCKAAQILTMLELPQCKQWYELIKEELIKSHRVLFLDVFKDFRVVRKLNYYDSSSQPARLALSGIISNDGRGFLVLAVYLPGGQYDETGDIRLNYWSFNQFMDDSDNQKPLDSKKVELKNFEEGGWFRGMWIVGSHNSDRYLIYGRDSWQIWCLDDGKLLHEKTLEVPWPFPHINEVNLSPDGTKLAVCTKQQSYILDLDLVPKKVITLEDLEEVGYRFQGDCKYYCPTWSEDGKVFCVKDLEGKILFMEADKAFLHENSVVLNEEGNIKPRYLSLSSDGRYLLSISSGCNSLSSGCKDTPILLWDVLSGASKIIFKRKKNADHTLRNFDHISFSMEGRYALCSFALSSEMPVLCDLVHGINTEVINDSKGGWNSTVCMDSELDFIFMVADDAWLISLREPMNSLSLAQFLLITKLNQVGSSLLKGGNGAYYTDLLESLSQDDPKNLQQAVRSYFL